MTSEGSHHVSTSCDKHRTSEVHNTISNQLVPMIVTTGAGTHGYIQWSHQQDYQSQSVIQST